MWMVKTDQIFAIHSTNQSIQQSFCSYYYSIDWKKNGFCTIFNIHMYSESAIYDPLIGCFVNIEEYSIPFKYRNVNERLILLITTTIKNQTHPIWINDDDQNDNSMVCDSLIYNRANDCWIDRMVNPAWFPILFNSIGFHPILV